jgi:type I restriction enzyme S subunit
MTASPATWTTRPLGEIATLQRGFDLPTRLRKRGLIPIVSSSGITGTHNESMVAAPGVVTGQYGTIGEVFYLDTAFWPLNTTLWVSDFHGNDERFTFYLLHRLDFASHSGKSGVPGVNRNDLHQLAVAIPVAPREQHRIAAALADADELIALLIRLIAKKDSLKQGVMQQLLTGDTRLPGFTAPWRKVLLGTISQIKTGSCNNQDKSAFGRYPFFVRSATVEHIDSYSYDCEAILVPGEGGIGSIFHYVSGKFEVHQRVYKISHFDADMNGRFIYYYMRQFFGRHAMENSVKATVDSLRLPTFRGFSLTVPADMQEQRAVAGVLDDASREIDLLHERLGKAISVKQGMMQELLTGRTRLPAEKAAT